VGRHEASWLELASEVREKQLDLERALRELKAARTSAEAANQIKSNFLRMMSHELKTPVTAMQLHMGLLERSPDRSASPKLAESIDRIARCTWRLVYMVDTVLEWARVESGRCRPSLETVDLHELLSGLVDEVRRHRIRKPVRIALTVPRDVTPSIVTDPRLARLLLVNLVDRALQLTDDGDVRVSLTVEDGAYVVSVHDGGRPISAEELRDTFDPFRATRELHRSSGAGSGLGLRVVADIASEIGGGVDLEAFETKGNLLTLRLPGPRRSVGGLRSVGHLTASPLGSE
jgi:signal transduction histidine kinase